MKMFFQEYVIVQLVLIRNPMQIHIFDEVLIGQIEHILFVILQLKMEVDYQLINQDILHYVL